MTPWFAAQLACLGLVGADLATRAFRIRFLVVRLGGRLSLGEAFRLNLLGDAAAELTPFRMAGEPSRVGALMQCGVAAGPALLAVGAELLLSYATVAMLLVGASWTTMPAWWAAMGSSVRAVAHRVPAWGLASMPLVVWLSFRLVPRRRMPTVPRGAGIRSSLRAVAGMGSRPLAALFGLCAISIAARVGILWMLVSTVPGAPAAGTVLVGSFVLLFGQAFAPTPSGVGVVEMGMLSGAAGALGSHAIPILVYWRTYTAVIPILLAVVFAVPRFGVKPVVAMLRPRRGPTRVMAEVEPASS